MTPKPRENIGFSAALKRPGQGKVGRGGSGKRTTIRCGGPHMPMRVERTRGNLVTAAEPLVNKLPMVEQRRLKLKARLAM